MKKIITSSDMKNYINSEALTHNQSSALLKEIHSMEPHTAYILLGGYLAPLVRSDYKELHLESENSGLGIDSSGSLSKSVQQAPLGAVNKQELKKILEPITKGLQEIEERMRETEKNYKRMPDLIWSLKIVKEIYSKVARKGF